MFTPFDTV